VVLHYVFLPARASECSFGLPMQRAIRFALMILSPGPIVTDKPETRAACSKANGGFNAVWIVARV
jgi:hypothetical protein